MIVALKQTHWIPPIEGCTNKPYLTLKRSLGSACAWGMKQCSTSLYKSFASFVSFMALRNRMAHPTALLPTILIFKYGGCKRFIAWSRSYSSSGSKTPLGRFKPSCSTWKAVYLWYTGFVCPKYFHSAGMNFSSVNSWIAFFTSSGTLSRSPGTCSKKKKIIVYPTVNPG